MSDTSKPMRRSLLLESASAVLIERPAATRRLLRSALHGIGLRELRELDRMPETGTEFGLFQSVDLVVVDLAENDYAGARLVANIRRRIAAFNPFITTIATSFTATPVLVSSAVNAGVDGILIKPFSHRQFYDRVLQVLERRRPFVVTANYIGPERRPGERPGASSASPIEVPNTLRDKLIQGRSFNPRDSIAAIESAWGRVNREFGISGACQILFLIRLAKSAFDDSAQEDAARELVRLRETAKELLARVAEPGLGEVASELADWITRRLDVEPGAGNGRALEQITRLTATLICRLGSPATPEALIQRADRAALEYRARRAAASAPAP
jgi:DNA-binding response OmpR family regulator